MATITEHQVVAAYLELNLAEKYRFVPNSTDKFKSACLDVFTFYHFKVDLSAEESIEKFKPLVLHYKKIIGKVNEAKRYPKKSVYHKFPDSAKLFYSPATYSDFHFITQNVPR